MPSISMWMVVNQGHCFNHCATWVVVGGDGGSSQGFSHQQLVLCCGQVVSAFDDAHSVYTMVSEKKNPGFIKVRELKIPSQTRMMKE